MVRQRTAVLALGAWLLPAIGVSWLASLPSPWGTWRQATCWPSSCFCEAIRDSWVRQPVNTVSSLGFVAVAVLVLGIGERKARPAAAHPLRSGWIYPSIYSTALVLIGLGSAFYHASLTFVGQTADVLGMYLLGTSILIYNWHRLRALRPATAVTTFLVGNAALLALLVELPGLRRYAFAAIILGALTLEWRIRTVRRRGPNTRLFLMAVSAIAVGFAIWILDITKVACAPQSVVQGHAVWHLLGATSAYLLYLFYVSGASAID